MARYSYNFGVFHVDPVPGQPQVAHCHSFFVFPPLRNAGKGKELKAEQMDVLRFEQYDYATCTIDGQNEAQRRILLGQGWRRLDTFTNSKTGGMTELWGTRIARDAAITSLQESS